MNQSSRRLMESGNLAIMGPTADPAFDASVPDWTRRPIYCADKGRHRPVIGDGRIPSSPSGPQLLQGPIKIRLLWIDDDIRPDDAAILLLDLEGYSVDCAASGAEGIRATLRSRYDAILLDWRLPDTDGLTVLKRLRHAGVYAPVLLLSGFASVEVAVDAIALGAHGVKSKPLVGDALIQAVRALTAHVGLKQEFRRGRLAFRLPSGFRSWDQGESSASRTTESSLQTSAVRLAQSDLSATDFIMLVLAFRQTVLALERGALLAARPSLTFTGVNSRHVSEWLAKTEAAIGSGCLLNLAQLLPEPERTELQIRDAGRAVRTVTGVRFTACRRALRLRSSLPGILFTGEQLAQLAFRAGYEHPAQFDRDFRAAFGVAPRTLRHLTQTDDETDHLRCHTDQDSG